MVASPTAASSAGEPFMRDDLLRSLLSPSDLDATVECEAFSKQPVGYRLPYYTLDGRPHPHMYRVRMHRPAPGKGKYHQPSTEELIAAGAAEFDHTYPYFNPHVIHPVTWQQIADDRNPKTLLIVEGEKKATAAGKFLSKLAVGIGGCHQAVVRDPQNGGYVLHPAILSLIHAGDKVEIVFDADVLGNLNVNKAAGTLRRVLRRLGVPTEIVLVPSVGASKVGLDDWIVSVGASAARAAFSALPRLSGDGGEFLEDSETLWGYLSLALNAKGIPLPHESNAMKVLTKHERYSGKLWYDVMRRGVYHTLRGATQPLTDTDGEQEAAWVQVRCGLHGWRAPLLRDSLFSIVNEPSMHRNPLLDDIESATWDDVPRLESMFVACCGATDDAHARAVGRNWLVGAVYRAYHPGCQMDTMLVLEGAQGIGKSKFMEIIAGGHYVSIKGAVQDKDFMLSAHRGWIGDIDELASFQYSDYSHIKSQITGRTDTIRAPYGRTHNEYPRRFVLVGTTNRYDYLRDETGNRRFWPIRCRDGPLDLEWLKTNRAQLLAEARAKMMSGQDYWTMPDQTLKEQADRMELDPWIGEISGILAAAIANPRISPGKTGAHVIKGGSHYFVATTEIMTAMGIPAKDMDRSKFMRVGRCVDRTDLGWVKCEYAGPVIVLANGVATSRVRGYILPVTGALPAANVTDISSKF
jgi:putative DNA primase/helicase